MSVYRLSTHLGGLKSTTRPGSVSASMQALLGPKQPPRGFRISVVGVELGASTIWVPASERRQSGLPEASKVGSLLWSSSCPLTLQEFGRDDGIAKQVLSDISHIYQSTISFVV